MFDNQRDGYQDRRPAKREEKPVFHINPEIIVALNCEMADRISQFIISQSKVPPEIFSFAKTLESEVKAYRR